ncbi:hypothetical protein SAMN05421770_101701 [Granulicella rosea]|uniref:Uncharacterized protein n=1 Tax=Granulicella rosea TaxID=474952 RepID=A0A239DZV1_9BACT|nr:hypothetical protein [Granulicella rosea]SNS37232.1 hypothetical protein SAMN05421770_101701 [Granulicella rosea]
MTAIQTLRNLSGARLFAVLLALPIALSTTGCSSTGILALSLGLHAHTQTTSDSDTPRTTHFASMPQFAGHPHRRAARPLLVESAHHQLRNDLYASRLADMKENVATDSFTPVAGDANNN